MTSWNIVDITAAVLLIGGTAYGYHRGLIRQLISLTGFIVAYVIAFAFYDDVAPLLRSWIPLTAFEPVEKYEGIVRGLRLDVYVYNAIAFALLLFLIKIGLNVAGHLLDWLSRVPGLNMANRWSGALLALAEAALIIVIAVHVIQYVPAGAVRDSFGESRISEWVLQSTSQFTERWTDLFSKSEETI
jgi:uncharacterized membrane protein required for colicin V production